MQYDIILGENCVKCGIKAIESIYLDFYDQDELEI
jgi:hypothetical protein